MLFMVFTLRKTYAGVPEKKVTSVTNEYLFIERLEWNNERGRMHARTHPRL
jgi:hypothetical protein